MIEKKIIASFLISLSLTSCGNKEIKNNTGQANIEQEKQNPISIKSYGLVSTDELDMLEKNTKLEIKDELDNSKDIYRVTYELSKNDIDSIDEIQLLIRDPQNMAIGSIYEVTDDKNPEKISLYFSINKETQIDYIDVKYERNGEKTLTTYKVNSQAKEASIEDNNFSSKTQSVIKTINLSPEVNLLIHDFKLLQKNQMNENEKSNLSSALKNPSDKIYVLEYSLKDNRTKKKSISKGEVSKTEDSYVVYMELPDGSKLSPISVYGESDDKEYYYKEYYLLEEKDEFTDIKVDSNIDGINKTSLSLGVEIASK